MGQNKKIIIIDPFPVMANGIADILQQRFPNTKVLIIKKEEYEEDIDALLKKESPKIVILTPKLEGWRNKEYGSSGVDLIPFITGEIPAVRLIVQAFSKDQTFERCKRLGADIACMKSELPKHFPEMEQWLDE